MKTEYRDAGGRDQPIQWPTMPAASSFGELLKDLRRAAGYSQEALAEHAGLSVGAVAALEQGWRRAPYPATVDALANALGVSPGARRGLEESAARARGRVSRGVPSIPIPLTSFVERNEVEEALKLLDSFRLVTVTGPPGVGKTRLTLEVAARSGSLFEEIWYVDLLPVRNGSLVAMQIAGAIDVPLEGADDLPAIVRRLRLRKALIVIDNCEHVIGDAAAAVTKLLQRCPSLAVLATSREALAVTGELLFRLRPMNEAVAAELFIERARVAGRPLVLDDRRRAIVAEICAELQGIPLAIELAASRLSALGFEELRKRLRSGITLAGGRDVPGHQQTMNGTIAWSYDLLNDLDRTFFTKLSVFAAGFTLEMAEGVFADASLLPGSIADGIARLLQKSLLEFEEEGLSTRYRFLDSIRTFALERLSEGGGLDDGMLRLIEWVAAKAQPLEAGFSLDLVEKLRLERENIGAAIIWAIATGRYPALEAAARLLYAVRLVFSGTTRQRDFSKLGFAVLQHLSDERSPERTGLLISALLPFVTDDELTPLASRGIRLLNATGHDDRVAVFYTRCATAACRRGDRDAAKTALAHTAARVSRVEPGSRARFTVAVTSAYVYALLKDFKRARAALEDLRIPNGDNYEIEALMNGVPLGATSLAAPAPEPAYRLSRELRGGTDLGCAASLTNPELTFFNSVGLLRNSFSLIQ